MKNILQTVGGVQRYHTRSGIPKQTIAEHSWGVAVLLQEFYPTCSKEAILYALYHDAAEHHTGDMPGPFKQESKIIKKELEKKERIVERQLGIYIKLNAKERKLLKICDLLELCLYLNHLIKGGNGHAAELLPCNVVHLNTYRKYFSKELKIFFDNNFGGYLKV